MDACLVRFVLIGATALTLCVTVENKTWKTGAVAVLALVGLHLWVGAQHGFGWGDWVFFVTLAIGFSLLLGGTKWLVYRLNNRPRQQ